jgi:hypothetical protein
MKQTVMKQQLKVRSIKGWSLQLAKYMEIDNLVVKGDSLTCIQSYCDTSACPSWRAQFIIEDFKATLCLDEGRVEGRGGEDDHNLLKMSTFREFSPLSSLHPKHTIIK